MTTATAECPIFMKRPVTAGHVISWRHPKIGECSSVGRPGCHEEGAKFALWPVAAPRSGHPRNILLVLRFHRRVGPVMPGCTTVNLTGAPGSVAGGRAAGGPPPRKGAPCPGRPNRTPPPPPP